MNDPSPDALGGLVQTGAGSAEPMQLGRVYPGNAQWLAKSPPESVIDPDRAIVDTHHHLWDMPNYRYLLPDFQQDLDSGHKVVATVFNECHAMYRTSGPPEMQPVGEVEFCADVAAMSESGRFGPTKVCAGIVGFADLTLGDRVEDVLRAQIAAGDGRFRGVRHAAGWDASPVIGNSHTSPGPGLYSRADFRTGLKRLSSLGLSLDAFVFHPQLADVTDLARAFPDTSIVLCHMGSPLGYGPYAGKRQEVFETWLSLIKDLAKCPNVSVKLGGVIMRLAPHDYTKMAAPPSSEELATACAPYVENCIELFGADRCMFESNFPIDKMGIGYRGIVNAFKRMVAGASESEKEAVFSQTAYRIYRLAH